MGLNAEQVSALAELLRAVRPEEIAGGLHPDWLEELAGVRMAILACDKFTRGLCQHEPCEDPVTRGWRLNHPNPGDMPTRLEGWEGFPAGWLLLCDAHSCGGAHPDERLSDGEWHGSRTWELMTIGQRPWSSTWQPPLAGS